MESLVGVDQSFGKTFAGRRILVTGHTGFKGAWLCRWLLTLGANVRGYALTPPTKPSLFEQLGLSSQLDDVRADIRDADRVHTEIMAFRPEIVFHLAAQPLVRYSYQVPLETYETNVMGTIHVLDALRRIERPCVAILVTTDKCYENREWHYGYREEDAMGGADPYSSSKGMAELAISAYRNSFFQDRSVRIASVRAGNVVGGGDWAQDRIVPDCMRALKNGEPIEVRNPGARRPWQHVLDPLHGYLLLAQQLCRTDLTAERIAQLCSSFNFGPSLQSNQTVAELVTEILKHWAGKWVDTSDSQAVHEAKQLNLAIDKAFHVLNWAPTWGFSRTVQETVRWFEAGSDNDSVVKITDRQIVAYQKSLAGNDGDGTES